MAVIEVNDLLGRMIFSTEVPNNSQINVPLNNYNNGVYIITVKQNNLLLYKNKLVKQSN